MGKAGGGKADGDSRAREKADRKRRVAVGTGTRRNEHSPAKDLDKAAAKTKGMIAATRDQALHSKEEVVDARVDVILQLLATYPRTTFADIVKFAADKWGVKDDAARKYWARALERFREIGNPEIGLARGRLVNIGMAIAEEYQRPVEMKTREGKTYIRPPDVNAVLSAMRLIADVLGLNRLQTERLKMDFERYERALKIEEERLKILGAASADGPFDDDGFEREMRAAAARVMNRGTVIDAEAEPKKDGG